MEAHVANELIDLINAKRFAEAIQFIDICPEHVTYLIGCDGFNSRLSSVCFALYRGNDDVIRAIFAIPGVVDTVCALGTNISHTPLQYCIARSQDISIILQTCRPCIATLKKALKTRPCGKNTNRKVYRNNRALIQHRLDQELSIYAVLWCFRQICPGYAFSILEDIHINATF